MKYDGINDGSCSLVAMHVSAELCYQMYVIPVLCTRLDHVIWEDRPIIVGVIESGSPSRRLNDSMPQSKDLGGEKQILRRSLPLQKRQLELNIAANVGLVACRKRANDLSALKRRLSMQRPLLFHLRNE